ncbi:MAG: hypothetical protein ABSF46_18685 [Terriglobia bacterium]
MVIYSFRAAERHQKVAHGASRGTLGGSHIRSPGGAAEAALGHLPPLRGSDSPRPQLEPKAYAVGYSLSALRASGFILGISKENGA